MGRGLSELQRKVLALAWVNRLELGEGLEWRIRLRHPASPNLYDKFSAAASRFVTEIKEPWRRWLRDPKEGSLNKTCGIPWLWVMLSFGDSGLEKEFWELEIPKRAAVCEITSDLLKAGIHPPWVGQEPVVFWPACERWFFSVRYGDYQSENEMQEALAPLLSHPELVARVDAGSFQSGEYYPDLFYSEAMADVCGLRGFLCQRRLATVRRLPHGNLFDRGRIGEKAYNAKNASLSRAISRLESRGLLCTKETKRDDHWTGTAMDLTIDSRNGEAGGRRTAQRILEESPEILDDAPLYREAWEKLRRGLQT